MTGTSINWEAVHGRMRKSEEALQDVLSENPARMRAVFRQRAIQLAKKNVDGEPVSPSIPVLVFRLGQERHAIALQELSEVVPFRDCTPIPGASPHFSGVITVRGELRPVIDLAKVLTGHSLDGLSESLLPERGSVLILRREAALKVDSIEELRGIRSDEVTPRVRGQYCQALASGTLTLLDVEAVLPAVFSAAEYGPL